MIKLPRVVIASNNQAKTAELIRCFRFCGYQAVSYLDIHDHVTFPHEGTDSYADNALQKAQFLQTLLPNELVVGDDSGMLLQAFPGRFGVTTARDLSAYRDEHLLNQHIIEILRDQPRGVTMVSYLALVGLTENYVGIGEFVGTVADHERGTNGTSFDRILVAPEFGQTLAELPDLEKLPLLHRTKAIQNLIGQIGE